MIGDAKSIKFEKNRRIVLATIKRDRAFVLFIETHNSESCCVARAESFRDWHERLAHVHIDAIRTMACTVAVELANRW